MSVALAACVGQAGAQTRTDLFCGDSLSFGFGRYSEAALILFFGAVEPAARGYNDDAVALFESLSGEDSVGIGLAVPGETTDTFVTGGALDQFLAGLTPDSLNINYSSPSQTQAQRLAEELAAAEAAGRPVRTFTLQLGVNNLLSIADAAFFERTPEQIDAGIASEIARARAALAEILTGVLEAAPLAQPVIVGYYNPFPALPDPSSDPVSMIAEPGVLAVNAALRGLAYDFRAVFVDPYERFVGREAALTFMDSTGLEAGNIHPEAAGYRELAVAYEAAFRAFCIADYTEDGRLDVFDVLRYFDLLAERSPAADLDRGQGTGVIDVFDVLEFFQRFGDGCGPTA